MTTISSASSATTPEVVRDQDHGRVEVGAAGGRAARGSAPGSSRRAPSSARRRSGRPGCTRAPSRSSRAGACRPRTGAGSRRRATARSGCRPGAAARSRGASRPCLPIGSCVGDRLDDLVADRVDRVQRRHRVLEDHRDLVAAHVAQPRLGQLEQVLALVDRPRPRSAVFLSRVSPSSVIAVTLLPEPDSPTIPSTSPRSSSKSTPSTAWTMPSSVANRTLRPFTSSRRSGITSAGSWGRGRRRRSRRPR